MAKRPRVFRTDASIRSEQETRAAIKPFLESRGFAEIVDDQKKTGNAISQFVSARAPSGAAYKMHVRLCWRRDGRHSNEDLYSAAQLRARLINDDWDLTLGRIVQTDLAKYATHILLVQPDPSGIVLSAAVPLSELIPIWNEQRRVSDVLIANGKAGGRTANHVENGRSPTLWLQDDTTPDARVVADVLWNWAGVIDIAALPKINAGQADSDSFDDLLAETQKVGRDDADKISGVRSGYPRDPKVRANVLLRANGHCERQGCGAVRDFKGFLDVHHILGVGRSDRPWSCVALCPNCHREAHFAPDHETINAKLAAYAIAFR